MNKELKELRNKFYRISIIYDCYPNTDMTEKAFNKGFNLCYHEIINRINKCKKLWPNDERLLDELLIILGHKEVY